MFLSIHHILPNLLLNTKISLSESDLRDISVICFTFRDRENFRKISLTHVKRLRIVFVCAFVCMRRNRIREWLWGRWKTEIGDGEMRKSSEGGSLLGGDRLKYSSIMCLTFVDLTASRT